MMESGSTIDQNCIIWIMESIPKGPATISFILNAIADYSDMQNRANTWNINFANRHRIWLKNTDSMQILIVSSNRLDSSRYMAISAVANSSKLRLYAIYIAISNGGDCETENHTNKVVGDGGKMKIDGTKHWWWWRRRGGMENSRSMPYNTFTMRMHHECVHI